MVCHVCLEPNTNYEQIENFTRYRCGTYQLRIINPPRITNESCRYIVSGHIRENQSPHKPFELTQAIIDRLETMPKPTFEHNVIRLMRYIEFKTTYYGEPIEIDTRNFSSTPELIAICYAHTINEVDFLRRYLYLEKLISEEKGGFYALTFKGFKYLESLKNNINSDLCFCAMCFDEDCKGIFDDLLEPAVRNAGWNIQRVDQTHYHEGVMDQIITLIRESKFVIADLTKNKKGVYFEAGFAKGFGKEIIFTCKEEDMKELHFDVRHYNFLVWSDKDLEKGKKELKARITATIGYGPHKKIDGPLKMAINQ